MVDTDPTPGTTVETEGDTTTGTTDGTTGDTDDTSTSTTDMMGVCGDGAIDAGEECDDGPDNGDMASCHSDCKLDVCGDALVGPAEGCDDGPDNGDMNACKADCTPAMCGDGLKGPGEGCDDGNADDADACTNACALATCGDSVVSVSEECDDGNQEDTDLCTNACTEAECGDLIVQPVAGEACDNGFENGDAGDCTADCNLAACGDGLIHNEGMGIEQCDNGGENGPGKACNAECLLNVCGDGDLGPGEGCDDGNLVAGDGCNASCVLEVCGNAVKDAGEACDDGKNGNQDDGCTDQCTTPICGDSFVQASLGETCDLGGQNSNTGACTLACKTAVCGDALVQAGVEQCDEGANNGNSKACKADCSDNVCGDGFVEVGVEDCDDANAIDNDACSNVCKAAACNDGVKNGQETDVDCGGPTCGLCPTVILLAGGNTGPNGHLGATFTNALGWTTTPLAGVTVTDLDLAMTSANVGVGVLRYTKIGDPLDNRLQYTVWNNGAWSPVAEVNDFTTRGRPTVASASATAQVLFHGSDFKYYYTAFSNGVWSAAEPTGSFGPIAGDIAALGNNAVTWFNDGGANNSLTTRSRVNGVWQPSMLLATQVNINISPALITLSGGNSELMGFWPYNAQGPVRFSRRTNGVWSAGADIPNLSTNERVAAVAIPGGNVALVYRGIDGKFHGMIFAAFFNAWQGPFDLPGAPNITGTPAIAPGIGTFEGEAAFISNGQVFHSRFNLETQSFTVPVAVGGAGIGSVALARSN
jgi:cysteine-rich repeat protein